MTPDNTKENEMNIDAGQLGAAIRTAIEHEWDDIIRVLARHINPDVMQIEMDDDEPDDFGSDNALWVVSTHTLRYDGEEIAEWTRCAYGHYGSQGQSDLADVWCVEEDTEGGDRLPDMVEVLLETVGIEDTIPDVPEPALATDTIDETPDGEWCVYWETVLDDAHPVKRYATFNDASAVCSQMSRKFDRTHPSGGSVTYQCGYAVRQLVEAEWRPAPV